MGQLGSDWILRHQRLRMVCLRLYSLLGIAGYASLDGDCRPWGGAGEELLGATPFGTASSKPNRGCGPRATAEAALHNVTKLHRQQTYGDTDREWASGAAGQSTRQA